MEILKFKCLESTQLYLMENLRNGCLRAPIMVMADTQSGGIGSRGNRWESVEDGLYFSFAIPLSMLPQDLPLESTSIYMGYIFKEILNKNGAQVWLKWPNDLYVDSKKAGGVMCSKFLEDIIVGVGINLRVKNICFGAVELKNKKETILEALVEILESKEKKFNWKQIFSKYSLEFSKNFDYGFHYDGRVVDMNEAILCDDGAILIENKKIYSLR